MMTIRVALKVDVTTDMYRRAAAYVDRIVD